MVNSQAVNQDIGNPQYLSFQTTFIGVAGVNNLIAGVAGKRIAILGYSYAWGGAVIGHFSDSTPAQLGRNSNSLVFQERSCIGPIFSTAIGAGLTWTTIAAGLVGVSFQISYQLV